MSISKDKVQSRIRELLEEQEMLVKEYNMLSQRMQEILNRLVQIQGSVNELQQLLKEDDQKTDQSQDVKTGGNITV